jgi:hypothetical protein
MKPDVFCHVKRDPILIQWNPVDILKTYLMKFQLVTIL